MTCQKYGKEFWGDATRFNAVSRIARVSLLI
jgi:hypothetical protein